jgi:hypothetical protein
MEYAKPHIIQFPKIGNSEIGFISIGEANKIIPFSIERVFWTYFTPQSLSRGRHAHRKTEQVLIAANGIIHVSTELPDGTVQNFVLDNPDIGVYVPPNAWHIMNYSHAAVQLVMASSKYDESDYIRDYDQFKTLWS